MTRKSRREIERDLEDLSNEPADSSVMVVAEDPETGELYEGFGDDAEPVDETEIEDAETLVVIIREEVVETGWEPDQ